MKGEKKIQYKAKTKRTVTQLSDFCWIFGRWFLGILGI
uniref:Uncharacterized protein n=1 Tax=Rhizophora mucronata TaxID=61149 RepID=A0A2P2KIH7_RHIMU